MPYVRRIAGALLVLMTLAPMHRLLDPAATGPAGAATRAAADAAWTLGLSGSLIVLALAWVAVRMLPEGRRPSSVAHRAWTLLLRPGPSAFALFVGAVSGAAASAVAWSVHAREPTSVDEMAQLLHAAAIAGGRMTIPLGESGASWVIQNGVVTDAGWASIYPPLHTLVLAMGLAAGLAWLVGPIMVGIATGATTWSVETLLDRETGRMTGLLLCLSPFWLLLGASYLSHTTTAAGLALLLLACVRSREPGARMGWALLAGAAAGLAVSARPWIGLTCATAIVAAAWAPLVRDRSRRADSGRALAGLVAGGLPFAVFLFWWNQTLFDHPLTLGYTVAFGPSHGLGFHIDPWGNRYGVLEALAYTGADIVQIGTRLLESPLPLTLLVGMGLLVGLTGGGSVIGSWLVAGIAANALYWHHGIHFGPRMMFELVPAWMTLVAVTSVQVFRAPSAAGWRYSRWVVGMALVAGVLLGTSTLVSRAGASAGTDASSAIEDLPSSRGTVFVHGSWASRVGARLAADGMRRDSIETALRRNDLCLVDRYARWRTGGRSGSPPALDFESLPGSPPRLDVRLLSAGNRIRIDPTVQPDASCRREARADRLGTLELEGLAWQSPALRGGQVAYARDLGPGTNLRVLGESEPEAWLLINRDEGGAVLVPYSEGMQLLWGGPSN